MSELARIIPIDRVKRERERPSLTPEHRAHLIQRATDLAVEAYQHELAAMLLRSESEQIEEVLRERQ